VFTDMVGLSKRLLVGLVAALLFAPVAGATTAQKIRADIDKVWNANSKHLVGMCVGAKAGATGVIRCHGKRVAGKPAGTNPKTLWVIDSQTKTFVATLLALRVHQHSLKLSSKVRTFFPASDKPGIGAAMTLQDLASHHSGLPRPQPSPPPLVVGDVFDQAASCEANAGCRLFAPGAQYTYSNFAFNVLGQILGQHDGFRGSAGPRAWDRDNTQNVTKPLGLTQTRTFDEWKSCCLTAFKQLRARGTGASGSPLADPPTFPGAPVTNPAGGLFSDAKDMFDWLRFSMGATGPPGLHAAWKLLYSTPSILQPLNNANPTAGKVGLAWQIAIHGATRCVYKGGSGLGFSSYVTFVEGRPRGVFVLLNTDNGIDPATPKVADLANAILDGLPHTGTKPVCSTSAPPADDGPSG
jgi:CubicO group peptidase (beta-lactamase class C family)